jgi:glycosyltransferase involved in cell wall biosynthesis
MNICHVNLASGFSGGERQTLQLIKQQLSMGYQLTVVANPISSFYSEIEKLNCTLIPANHFLKTHGNGITKNCQLIHVHEGRAIYWALIQSKLHNIPYIVTRRIDNPLKDKWLSKFAYKNASAVVGLSREINKQVLLRHPDQVTEIIPSSPVSYPIDTALVDSIKERFKGKFLVIQAANLLAHKGHDVTIRAAKQIEAISPNIHIAILGDGKERQNLEQQATGLQHISFEGKQTDMGSWFAAADLLIHPSYSEGLGSVILEAIQAGLVTIGSNAGGIPDIIEHEQSGLLVEPGDDKSLAHSILQVAENQQLRDSLRHGGREKLAQFDIRYTAVQYQSLYQKVINHGI